jgi:outer membrane protein assembly factor BamA
LVAVAVVLAAARPAAAGESPVGKVVADVIPLGNRIHPKEHILSQMQTKAGKPYDETLVADDVRRLIATRWFAPKIDVETKVGDDGRVTVYLHVTELEGIVQEVVFVGNQHVGKDDLINLTQIRKGSALNPAYNEAAAQIIQNKLREDGRYYATVSVAEGNKLSDQRVVFQIVEGPVVRVSKISFRGCRQTSPGRLATQVTMSAPAGGVLRAANSKFNPIQLGEDKKKLIDYMHKLGHLEARVHEDLVWSADLTGVEVVYYVDEGPVYTVREVRLERAKMGADDAGGGLRLFPEARVRELIELKPGGRYDRDVIVGDGKRIEAFYGFRGHRIAVDDQWVAVAGQPGQVDVVYTVIEPGPRTPGSPSAVVPATQSDAPARSGGGRHGGRQARGQSPDDAPPAADPLLGKRAKRPTGRGQVPDDLPPGLTPAAPPAPTPIPAPRPFVREPDRVGRIIIRGNTVTHQDVILNELSLAGIRSGQILQYPSLKLAEQYLIRRGIFDQEVPPTVEAVGNDFDSVYKDVVVSVTETRTGQFLIGAGINSNSGLNGNIVLNERNFDILRPPTSFDDFLNGRAFRGRGEELRLEAMPGTIYQRYSLTFREPYLLNTQYGLTASAYYFNRAFAEYTEDRFGGRFSIDRRLDAIWRVNGALRVEGVNLHDPDPRATPAITDFLGQSTIVGLRGGLNRDTRDSFLFPTTGSVFDVGYEQVTGSYTFPIGTAEYTKFFSSQYFQRKDGSGKHVVAARSQLSVTSTDAPVFERFYAGGFRSLRGFTFRGISPVENDVHVGGSFAFLNSLEYQIPLNAKDSLFFVTFIDHGTVERTVTIKDYRVAVGFGFRVSIPALGPVPVAFDFAFPLNKTDGDNRQVFAFYVGLFGGQ